MNACNKDTRPLKLISRTDKVIMLLGVCVSACILHQVPDPRREVCGFFSHRPLIHSPIHYDNLMFKFIYLNISYRTRLLDCFKDFWTTAKLRNLSPFHGEVSQCSYGGLPMFSLEL